MIRNHELIAKVRNNKVILAIGVLAASATLLAGCGAKAEQATKPLSQLDVTTLSTADAIQYVEVVEAIEKFQQRQLNPDQQLINGVNDLYSRYQDPLEDITFGSGWQQALTGIIGIISGNQEQVTEINARDAVEEVIRVRALEIASTEDKPEDAAEIVDKYIDDQGNITTQNVLIEIADNAKD